MKNLKAIGLIVLIAMAAQESLKELGLSEDQIKVFLEKMAKKINEKYKELELEE